MTGPREDDEDHPPAWFAGQYLPEDAKRIGLDHRVPDGALLDFAGQLDSRKAKHRITAWVMLLALGLPFVLLLWQFLTNLAG